MQKPWSVFVFRAALSYAAAVVLLSVLLLVGGDGEISCAFLLELLGLTAVIGGIDYLFGRIPFRSRLLYLCMELLSMYAGFLAFAYFGNWFGFSAIHLLAFSGMFLALFLLLHLYDHFMMRTEADRINRKLANRKTI